jgi:hypothetical protein
MSGSSQNPSVQSNVKFTSIHTLVCRFQGHYDVMKVKFMVDCTSMNVRYHKSIPLITSKNGKLYDYVTLGFHLSALVETCSISRYFVMVQLWKNTDWKQVCAAVYERSCPFCISWYKQPDVSLSVLACTPVILILIFDC